MKAVETLAVTVYPAYIEPPYLIETVHLRDSGNRRKVPRIEPTGPLLPSLLLLPLLFEGRAVGDNFPQGSINT